MSIGIVATGGTIQNTVQGRTSIQEILERAPHRYQDVGVDDLPDVSIVDVLRMGSEQFRTKDWLVIGRAVAELAGESHVQGVVVTHGTFTAEETAYFLHLTISTRKPLVLVCSQRKHLNIGNDGDRNLIDALRVASSSDAWGKGALVVMNEEIHSAREVTKVSQRPSGFVSGDLGILGFVARDQVVFYRSPARCHTNESEFDVRTIEEVPRVDIAATYVGADAAAIRAFLEAGARGIVVNGFAYSGEPHPEQVGALEDALANGIPVVLVSRGNSGMLPRKQEPFIRGDNLSAQKARVLLGIALTRTSDTREIQRIFDQY